MGKLVVLEEKNLIPDIPKWNKWIVTSSRMMEFKLFDGFLLKNSDRWRLLIVINVFNVYRFQM